MHEFVNQIAKGLQGHAKLPMGVLESLVWTVLAIAVYILLRVVLSRLYEWRIRGVGKRYLISKTTTYVLVFLLLVFLGWVWLSVDSGMAAYFGILSAGLAVALHAPVTNIAGWLFIIIRRPFTVGDRIQVGDNAGDVIDIRLFQFTLVEIGNWVDADQSTGRVIHVPNGWVFQNALANYTQGFNFIWDEVPVMVTFESNWEKAKKILLEIAGENPAISAEQAQREVGKAARNYMIFYQHLKPIVWTTVADSGVVLTMRYLCEPRKRRSTQTVLWEKILQAFAEADDIDFAYPTNRMYLNATEGKPEAGGPPKGPVR